jgi:hypothetical protein
MSHSQDVEMAVEDTHANRACHDEVMPSLDLVSESEDSYGCSSSANPTSQSVSINPSEKKRVSWDRIHTREFALVVGDHPLCQDGLPVSLDWHHMDDPESGRKITCQEPLSERRTSYAFPKRLSYEERKQRICSVSGLTHDQVKSDEIDLVVRTLQETLNTLGEDAAATLLDPTPIAEDMDMMQVWDDLISQHVDLDLGDMSDFEWTD